MADRKENVFRIVTSVILVSLLAGGVYFYLKQPEIAYVRSFELIEKYRGTVEARADFEKKKSSMQANVDSLQFDFERAKNEYLASAGKLTGQQRMEQENILMQRQSQLMQYGQAIDEKVKEEDSMMMQEILNQINSYVEEYAKQHGYDVVLGTTLSGSLLYGEASLDITDDLLIQLNEKYRGK